MADIFVNAAWGPRKESITQCAERLGRFLKALSKQDRLFAKWYRKIAAGRKKKQECDFGKKEDLVKIVEEYKHPGRGPNLGYVVGLWNGEEEPRAAGLLITCGLYDTNPHISNCVVLDLPDQFPGISNAQKMAGILSTLAEQWDADDGGVTSITSLNKRDLSKEVPYVDWIFYGSKKFYVFDSLPKGVTLLPVKNKGAIVVLRSHAIDYGDREDFRLIQAVEKAIGIDRMRQLRQEKLQEFARAMEEERKLRKPQPFEFTPPPAPM
jgi:hypothetical protein